MNPFSNLKPAWHLDRIRDIRNGKNVVPTHLQIVISDLCNQNCHFCAYRMDGGFSASNFADSEGNKNPKRFIPLQKAWEILDDAKEMGVEAIEFTGGGEPTVHPGWEAILEHAVRLGFQVGLVTNAVRLTNWELLDKLTWLRISLDAGTADTYKRIRESAQFDKVVRNIYRAGTLKLPYIGVGFVITRENFHELVGATRIAKEAGVPYLRISAMFSTKEEKYYAGILNKINEQRALAKGLYESDSFKIVDFFDNRLDDLRQKAPTYSLCGYQQFVLYIGADQKIYTCCTNAYTKHGEIGDLMQTSFKKWLIEYDRLKFDARSCHHCQFNDKNKVIEFLANPNPPHVNFV